jgi:hypothetical protein
MTWTTEHKALRAITKETRGPVDIRFIDGRYSVRALMSQDEARNRFAAQMQAEGREFVSLSDLTAEIARIQSEPLASATGATLQGCLEQILCVIPARKREVAA